jgi:hypothetical protein
MFAFQNHLTVYIWHMTNVLLPLPYFQLVWISWQIYLGLLCSLLFINNKDKWDIFSWVIATEWHMYFSCCIQFFRSLLRLISVAALYEFVQSRGTCNCTHLIITVLQSVEAIVMITNMVRYQINKKQLFIQELCYFFSFVFNLLCLGRRDLKSLYTTGQFGSPGCPSLTRSDPQQQNILTTPLDGGRPLDKLIHDFTKIRRSNYVWLW